MSCQAEANLTALIESSEDLLGSVDLEYRLLTFNRAFQKHIELEFGVRPDLGMRPQDMLTPGRAALWPPLFQRALNTGPFRLEYPLVNGRILELAFSPIVVKGQATGISVFGKDITERKAAEKSQQFLAKMVESSDDAIFAYSPTGAILTWNRGAEAIFGYGSDEVIGKPLSMLVLPPSRPEVDQFTEQVLSGHTLYAKAGTGIRKDGRIIHVSVTTWPVHNDAGHVEAISLVVRDVTRQREADQARSLLASIVESSYEAIHAVGPDGTVTSWNPGAELLTGYSREEALGMSVAMFLPPEDRHSLLPRLEIVNGGKSLNSIEIVLQRKDGGRIDVSLSGSPILNSGKVIGASVILRDISQRKLLHSQLVQAEKKYHDIFDGAVEGMFQTSPHSQVIIANRALAAILAYDSPADVVASISALREQVWVDPDEYSDFHKKLKEHGSVSGFECRFRRKDGVVIWAFLSCRMVFASDGRHTYNEGSILDITGKKLTETRLRESEARYRETFEQAVIGISHISLDGEILWCNSSFAQTLGYLPDEARGLRVEQITPLDFLPETARVLESLFAGTVSSETFEKPCIRKDGTLRWVKATVSVQRDEGNRPLHLIAFAEDIHARREAKQELAIAQEALRTSEERYRTVFQKSMDAVCITRRSDGTFVDANRRYLLMMEYSLEEIIGRTSASLGMWVNAPDREQLVKALDDGSDSRNLEIQFKRKNGEKFWALASPSAIDLDGEPCILSIVRDLTESRAAQERIRNLAFFDPLTGLPNRRMLMDRLWQPHDAHARRKRALLFLDLDHFKSLNDAHGHSLGDVLLKEVANRISSCIREYDAVARVGGDEFAILLENLNESFEEAATQARLVGDKILASLREPFLLGGHECYCSSSLGIDVFGQRPHSTAEALQRAEIAMSQAKEAGRNTARFFAPAQQEAVNARAALEEQLRLAIKKNQFVFYYQPQIEKGRLTGVEALIRWFHPTRGLVPPDHFISLAEDTGLILPIGEIGLESACAQLAAWSRRTKTADLSISVNISARHLRQPDFVQKVLSVLDSTGARPQNLRLELTESMLSHNIDDTIAKMTELKSHGVRFCLDDFGTGYSSLSYLKRLPISRLKIDRAFVKDILVDAASGAIAQTIISLGRALEISVIAEGVETEEQRGYLAGMGCHSYQGYLFSPPLPIREFEQFLDAFSRRHHADHRQAVEATGPAFEI